MNVASLENCKTLWKLSEWGGDFRIDDVTSFIYKEAHVIYRTNKSDGGIPAYDLGYLLRKLPQGRDEDINESITLDLGFSKAQIRYHKSFRGDRDTATKMLSVEADIPEDAACKLAIELFKQGVLTK